MAIIIFKSILSTANLGNIDGTLERPNCYFIYFTSGQTVLDIQVGHSP